MALSGDLKDFGLIQLLTLVQVTRKSGMVTLTRANESATLHFENGLLTKINPPETRVASLATALFRAGRIGRESYERISTQAPPSEQAVGILLADQAGLTQEEIVDFVRERMLAELNILFTWPDGGFLFDVSAPPPEDTILAPTELASVVQKARGFLEEWEMLVSYIPSLDRPLRLLPEPKNPVQQISLNLVEWRMVASLSGDVALKEVAQRLGLDDFAVRQVAHRLISAGLADVPEPQSTTPPPPPPVVARELDQTEQKTGTFSRLFSRG